MRKAIEIMKTKLSLLFPLILILFAINARGLYAQTTASATQTNPLATLPASDVVLFADVRRIVSEAMPRALAGQPELLAKMMGMVNEVKAKSGLNPLAIERVAVGVKLIGPMKPGMRKENIGIAIIAQGDFDANALLAFIKRESEGKAVEETYGGKVIYSEPRPEPPRMKAEREIAAVTLLDANTLAIGDLPQIRATIDAAAGKDRIDPALASMGFRDESALVGIAANITPSFAENLSIGTAPGEMERAGVRFVLALFKHALITIGSTADSFNLTVGLGFCDALQAQSIRDMLNGLRKADTPLSRNPQLRGLMDAIQVTAEGNEMRVRADIKNEIVQHLIGEMMKPRSAAPPSPATTQPAAQTAPTKSQPTRTKSRRGRRRRS